MTRSGICCPATTARSGKPATSRPSTTCWVDDYVDHDPSPGFGPGKEAAKQLAAAVTSSMKDGRLTIRNVIVEGDRAAGRWTHTWTQVGDFLGKVPADGKQIQLRGHDFFVLRDGRIAEIWHCEDFFGVLGQLGVLPGSGPG